MIKDDQGNVLNCTAPTIRNHRGGSTPDGRKVRGTIHWVSAAHALDATVRLYDRLFSDPDPRPGEVDDERSLLNPDSLRTVTECKVEPGLADAVPGVNYQFERLGYFCIDAVRIPVQWPRVQPDHRPARYMGEDPEEVTERRSI